MKKLEFNISTKIYEIKAITSTAHKYSEKYYIQIKSFSDEFVQVCVQTMQENDKILDNFSNVFHNELLDQQIRVSIEKDFGHIRDIIVKKAFLPINE